MNTRGQAFSLVVPVACLLASIGYVELRKTPTAEAVVRQVDPGGSLSENGLVRGGETSADRQRIARLERDLRRLEHEARERANDVAAKNIEAPNPGADAIEATPMTPEERRAEREAQIAKDRQVQRDYFDELNTRVENEPVDTAWRRTTQQRIEDVFPQGLGEGFSVSEVTCASTVCRVQLSHPEFEKLPFQRVRQLSLVRGDLGTMEFHYDTKSKLGATTVYMLRSEAEPTTDG